MHTARRKRRSQAIPKGRTAKWLLPVVLLWLALSPSGHMQTTSDVTSQTTSNDKISSSADLKLFVIEKTLKLIIPKSETKIGVIIDISELEKNSNNDAIFKSVDDKTRKFVENKVVKTMTDNTIKECKYKGATVVRLTKETTKGWNAITRYMDSTKDTSTLQVNVTIKLRGLENQIANIISPLEDNQSELDKAAKAYNDANTGTGDRTGIPALRTTLSELYCKVIKDTIPAASAAQSNVRHYSEILNMLANNRIPSQVLGRIDESTIPGSGRLESSRIQSCQKTSMGLYCTIKVAADDAREDIDLIRATPFLITDKIIQLDFGDYLTVLKRGRSQLASLENCTVQRRNVRCPEELTFQTNNCIESIQENKIEKILNHCNFKILKGSDTPLVLQVKEGTLVAQLSQKGLTATLNAKQIYDDPFLAKHRNDLIISANGNESTIPGKASLTRNSIWTLAYNTSSLQAFWNKALSDQNIWELIEELLDQYLVSIVLASQALAITGICCACCACCYDKKRRDQLADDIEHNLQLTPMITSNIRPRAPTLVGQEYQPSAPRKYMPASYRHAASTSSAPPDYRSAAVALNSRCASERARRNDTLRPEGRNIVLRAIDRSLESLKSSLAKTSHTSLHGSARNVYFPPDPVSGTDYYTSEACSGSDEEETTRRDLIKINRRRRARLASARALQADVSSISGSISSFVV